MSTHNRPASKQEAPDPATSYERAKPENEAGMGRLDNIVATPTDSPDRQDATVQNRQPSRQINAHDATDQRQKRQPGDTLEPDHSMNEEEPLGEDQAPFERTSPRNKRHPRKEGKGGTR
jgi:hypothetical protein